jgi:hypothetical protein
MKPAIEVVFASNPLEILINETELINFFIIKFQYYIPFLEFIYLHGFGSRSTITNS